MPSQSGTCKGCPPSKISKGEAQLQGALQSEWLDDYLVEENPVRVVDVFVDELDLGALGFKSVDPATGHPAYPSCISLKIYIYG